MGFYQLIPNWRKFVSFEYIAISAVTVKSPSAHDILVEIVSEIVPINCSYRFLIDQRFISLE